MNPATALARVLVDELVRGGVREAVLSPGSRSAPLAFALEAADGAGRLRLHVRVDERSAGFLALGLAKASGQAVPVVTTSGTAAVALHPAVVEAALSGVPLLALTADRPPELRGTGANQTIDQRGLYGPAVRLLVELGTPEERAGQQAGWRSTVCRVLAAARGEPPGPVHVNVPLREPLVPGPDGPAGWPEPLDGRPGGEPWTAVLPAGAAPPPPARPPDHGPPDDLPPRTLVVLGDPTGPHEVAAALDLAAARGFPVVAEPSAGACGGPVVAAGELVLAAQQWLAAHRPERVLVVGRPTLSRQIGRVVAAGPTDVVASRQPWPDPAGAARRVLPAVPRPDGARDDDWLPAWLAAGERAEAAVAAVLAGSGASEPVVAREVADAAAGGLLVVGSSKPVRDLLLAGGRPGLRVLANRGAAGIDGVVSTAVGAALAAGRPTYALLGDLTLLHDANGLVLGPQEPRPDLTVVVVNNDGGAIFGQLEQGDPAYAAAFERVFGTPHGVDLAALCAATGTGHTRVETVAQLRAALPGPGLRVVEVRTDRAAAVELDRRLRAAATAAVEAPASG